MTTIESAELDQVTGGGSPWIAAAKREAINFSARENGVSPSSLRAPHAKFWSKEGGVRYYAIGLDNGEALNVGLRRRTGRPAVINYVGDGA